jgi:hypothetical protein
MATEFNYPSSIEDIGLTKVAIIVTNNSADQDSQGADHDCKRVLIKAHNANTGLCWVDFGVAAVEAACYPLDAGETISVPLTNTDEIHVLFKVMNEKVAVVYSN